LLEKYKLYGRRWKLISTYLPGRCEVNIKNKFYSLQRKAIIKNQSHNKIKSLEAVPSKKEDIDWVETIINEKKSNIKEGINYDIQINDKGERFEENKDENKGSWESLIGEKSNLSDNSDKQLIFGEME